MEKPERLYIVSKRGDGYGARICVRKELKPFIHNVLNKLCKWGGSVQVNGGYIAWEFNDRDVETAERYVISRGFRKECGTEEL